MAGLTTRKQKGKTMTAQVNKRHYMAIKYSYGTRSVEVGPVFGHRRKDTFFHWHGPSRMSWPKTVTILADYGMVDPGDYDALDALEVKYARGFPWLSGVAAGGGWLGPGGSFFPCRSWEHDSSAYLICLAVYGTTLPGNEGHGTIDRMEKLGWIKLYDDLVVRRRNQTFTQAQIDTLGDLSQVSEQSEGLIKSIRECLSRGTWA